MKILLIVIAIAGVWAWRLGYLPNFRQDQQSCDASGRLCLRMTSSGSSTVDIVGNSKFKAPVTVEVELFARDSKVPDGEPKVEVLEKAGERRLVRYEKPGSAQNWPPPFSFTFQIGDHEAFPDSNAIYTLPFDKGQAVKVTAAGASKNHTGGHGFGIDFQAPLETPVHAAREGIVVDVVQNNRESSSDTGDEGKTNLVRVFHLDRTVGVYLHLKQDSVKVKEGQDIAAGELLGYVGNAEAGSEPHLHFELQRPKGGKKTESFPVKFSVGEPAEMKELVQGQSYTR